MGKGNENAPLGKKKKAAASLEIGGEQGELDTQERGKKEKEERGAKSTSEYLAVLASRRGGKRRVRKRRRRRCMKKKPQDNQNFHRKTGNPSSLPVRGEKKSAGDSAHTRKEKDKFGDGGGVLPHSENKGVPARGGHPGVKERKGGEGYKKRLQRARSAEKRRNDRARVKEGRFIFKRTGRILLVSGKDGERGGGNDHIA